MSQGGKYSPSLAIHFIGGARVFVHSPQDKRFCVQKQNKNTFVDGEALYSARYNSVIVFKLWMSC